MNIRIVMSFFILVLCTFHGAGQDTLSTIASEDYGFDLDSYQKKPFEYSLLLDIASSLAIADIQSPLARLRYQSLDNDFFDSWLLRTEGSLRFSYKWFTGYCSAAAGLNYFHREDSLVFPITLYETYGKATPSLSMSIQLGKRTIKWGKGYLYSPVSFISRQKDINDIEANLEGYWMASAEYIKSFVGPLSNFSATICVLPVVQELNKGAAKDRTGTIATQLYFLLFDTDIDLYGITVTDGSWNAGADFSRNLRTNLEFHADLAYSSHLSKQVFTANVTPVLSTNPAWEALAGVRLLTSINTTFIVEYLHRNGGYTASEMNAYHSALGNSIQSQTTSTQRSLVSQISSQFYAGQFIMRNYLYIRASQPDFLNIVYFNPSAYCLLNLEDFSCMAGVELSYTRFKHASFLLRYAGFAGKQVSEYGMKPFNHRIDLRMRLML